jgi:excisionase family DNA binding protein
MKVSPGQLSLNLESALTAAPAPEPAESAARRQPKRLATGGARKAAPGARASSALAPPEATARVEKLLTVAEVGRLTGLSLNAGYRAIWSGELRASKLRGRIRVSGGAVEAWVDAGRVPTGPSERARPTRSRCPRPTSSGRGLRELLQTAAPPG